MVHLYIYTNINVRSVCFKVYIYKIVFPQEKEAFIWDIMITLIFKISPSSTVRPSKKFILNFIFKFNNIKKKISKGGGIYTRDCLYFNFEDILAESNVADSEGGGIFLDNNSNHIKFNNLTFRYNQALDLASSLHIDSSKEIIINNTYFYQN